ncbi:hypothetical protein GCM10027168_68090 [Streptomyces capparidis]
MYGDGWTGGGPYRGEYGPGAGGGVATDSPSAATRHDRRAPHPSEQRPRPGPKGACPTARRFVRLPGGAGPAGGAPPARATAPPTPAAPRVGALSSPVGGLSAVCPPRPAG